MTAAFASVSRNTVRATAVVTVVIAMVASSFGCGSFFVTVLIGTVAVAVVVVAVAVAVAGAIDARLEGSVDFCSNAGYGEAREQGVAC